MREMQVSDRIANLVILAGLGLIVVGSVMAFPFVRDTLQAQSAASALSFAITLEPPKVEATSAVPAGTSTPLPPATVAVTATATSLPSSAVVATPTTTSVPTPFILPDDSSPSTPITKSETTLEPTPVVAGDPPSRIVIPAIDLDAPIVIVGWHIEVVGDAQASVWDVPDWYAAGWLKTSAPAGQKGNTVLDGHHNIKGQVFRRLVDLKPRDEIELYVGSQVLHYMVTEKHILPDRDQPLQVRMDNAKWIQPTDDERLTLVTCWPYTNNTHRLIIVARPFKLKGGNSVE